MNTELFMQRTLELAKLGMSSVSPNPLVGCVIVHDNKIIGEGWHQQYGQPHAEVNAIASVADKSLLSHSTLYVNLEPCAHFGKTPPCTDLLIQHKIKRVIIANSDPNPLVNGNGIKKLTENNIDVTVGVLEHEGATLNKRFFTAQLKHRPYIILKWAQTADGFIAHKNLDSKWISSELSRQLVHKWRSEEDAVLVGGRTVQHDNPQLNVRDWSGRNPIRIIFDRFLRLNENLHVFDKNQPTLCYNVLKHEEYANLVFIRVSENNFIQDVLHDMHQRKIQSVLVEGGTETFSLFLEKNLWDEARVFTSDRNFESGIAAPLLPVRSEQTSMIGNDRLELFYNRS